MAPSKPSLVTRQIDRVSRRLFVQRFLNYLAWCWTAALVLSTVWLLLQPLLLEEAAEWVRWAVVGGLVTVATLLAGGRTIWTSPSRVSAALELDERFGLKERITTSLLLTPEQQATPAGQALLDDVTQRVGQLDIPTRFPVRLNWPAALVPAAALVVALVAVFYEPPKIEARNNPADELTQAPVNVVEINQKMNQLKRKPREKTLTEQPSEELARIEAELEKIANRPRDTREQLKQRIKEMQQLEDEIRDRQKQRMEQSRSLQQQLQQLDRQMQRSQDGPTNNLEKALADGDFNKAQEEIEKLAERLRNNELSGQDKEKLKERLKDLQEKLDRLARNKDKEEELKRLAREGKLDSEALQRELERLQRENQNLEDLADLADKLGQCRNALENGDTGQALQQLRGAADKLRDLDLDEKELRDLDEQLQRLREAKEAASRGDRSEKGANGDRDGQGGSKQGEGGKGSGKGKSGPNNGGVGEGERELGQDDGKGSSFEAKQKIDPNWKGKKIFDSFAPGQNFKSKSSAEIAGEVKQAAQEAPEAIEQQRIPKAARDIAKGYFKNLGNQDDRPPEK